MAILKKIGNGLKDVANIFFDDLIETEKEKAEKAAAAKPKRKYEEYLKCRECTAPLA